MRPHTFAKQECANYEANGECLGITITDDLEQTRFGPLSKCKLLARERCAYFEDCVLPMVNWTQDPLMLKERTEAKRLYAKWAAKAEGVIGARPATGILADGDLCPDCKKHSRPSGAMRCPVCAKKRQKSMSRERKRAERDK